MIPIKHKIVALLPMKAHSARIPQKNFRLFSGKPLFRWILDTLLSIDHINQVVINTDARNILLDNGLTPGPKILLRDRPKDLCGDFVSMNKIIENDIASVDAQIYLMTHVTNPLLSAATIQRALATYEQELDGGHCDSLFTVNRFQSRFYRQDGSAVNHNPAELIRTQDLEPWFEENSNLYLFTKGSFARTEARIGLHPLLFVTPRLESLDIDDQDGWNMAELIAKATMGGSTP